MTTTLRGAAMDPCLWVLGRASEPGLRVLRADRGGEHSPWPERAPPPHEGRAGGCAFCAARVVSPRSSDDGSCPRKPLLAPTARTAEQSSTAWTSRCAPPAPPGARRQPPQRDQGTGRARSDGVLLHAALRRRERGRVPLARPRDAVRADAERDDGRRLHARGAADRVPEAVAEPGSPEPDP